MSAAVSKGWFRRLFTLRNAAKIVLWTLTLIVLFYVEEDWRGAREWAATKAKWEAKGISFDPQAYVPPPIPDDQNLGAIPLFKLEPDPETEGALEPLALRRAMGGDFSRFSVAANWQEGQAADREKIRVAVAEAYTQTFKRPPPSKDMLQQFDALYPAVSQLTAISEVRPKCRFQQEYIGPGRPFGLITTMINVAKHLNFHALLALDSNKPDVALQDFATNLKLASGVQRDPRLVGGLVTIGMMAIAYPALGQGLSQHAWNDAQLARLQDDLGRIDFLKNYQFVMQGEVVTDAIPAIDRINRMRRRPGTDFLNPMKIPSTVSVIWNLMILPNGWFDMTKSRLVEAYLNQAQTVSPALHRISPQVSDELENQIQAVAARPDANAEWNYLFTLLTGSESSAASKFAVSQARLDEARIACGLERYRLVHGAYPETLEGLAPDFITGLPHDIASGEPYRYRLRPDGSYLLYSVGWNERDDGGKIIYDKDQAKRIDFKQGDWVWPMPKLVEKSP